MSDNVVIEDGLAKVGDHILGQAVAPVKRKRGRPAGIGPKKEYVKPKCALEFLNKFPDHIKVFYPSTTTGGKDRFGILVFKYTPVSIGIARFSQNDDGTFNWIPRRINKKGGGVYFIYDLVEVSMQNATEVASALTDGLQRWFGGDKVVEKRLEPFKQKQVDKHLDEDMKRIGSIF